MWPKTSIIFRLQKTQSKAGFSRNKAAQNPSLSDISLKEGTPLFRAHLGNGGGRMGNTSTHTTTLTPRAHSPPHAHTTKTQD